MAVQNQTTLLVLALFVVGAVALLFFAQQSIQPAALVAPLNVVWNFNQPASESAGATSALELTVYNAPSSASYYSYGSGLMEFNPSNGIALVKEQRSAELASGLTHLSVEGVAAHLSPGSVRFSTILPAGTATSDARVLEQDYDYDLVSADKILEKYIDKTITLRSENRTFTGKLLSVSPLILQTSEGVKLFTETPQIETLPELPEGLITKPTLNWLLEVSKPGKHNFELSYLTSGISWKTEYVAYLYPLGTDYILDLNSWVSVTNDAGATFKDASLKLVAGEVNLVQASNYYDYGYGGRAMVAEAMPAAAPAAKQFTEQQLFEYHLYTLSRPTTLKNGETKQIELFSAQGLKAKSELVYESSRSDRVRVNVEFENKKENGLGVPMPAGLVRVYQSKEFVGEDSIEHTADGEKVRLFVGEAFDLSAEREQTDFEQVSRCTTRQSYKIVVRNAKENAADVNVVEHSYGDWQILKESHNHVKDSSDTFAFTLHIPANGEETLTYTLEQRYRYC